ncbi:DUF378 domain-containing protein [Aneurinibacillus sp. REN35]|uniref:DUF378 domain-containing protein n=1 Tax=Aneurinibacillus sp. REN35 TaxID=3237286 RepID=UPI00352952CE
MNTLLRIALILVIIGAINWGLVGFFQFDLVAALFGGQDAVLSRIVYGLVGISGVYAITLFFAPEKARM